MTHIDPHLLFHTGGFLFQFLYGCYMLPNFYPYLGQSAKKMDMVLISSEVGLQIHSIIQKTPTEDELSIAFASTLNMENERIIKLAMLQPYCTQVSYFSALYLTSGLRMSSWLCISRISKLLVWGLNPALL